MAQLWIEGVDESGSDFRASWGEVTDAQIDMITEHAESVLGRAHSVN